MIDNYKQNQYLFILLFLVHSVVNRLLQLSRSIFTFYSYYNKIAISSSIMAFWLGRWLIKYCCSKDGVLSPV